MRDLQRRADWSRCAVVGSSGVLSKSRLGAEIDAHTAVIRFNNAPAQVGRALRTSLGRRTGSLWPHPFVLTPDKAAAHQTQKYAVDVGAKTTLRVQNQDYCGHAESDREMCINYTLRRQCTVRDMLTEVTLQWRGIGICHAACFREGGRALWWRVIPDAIADAISRGCASRLHSQHLSRRRSARGTTFSQSLGHLSTWCTSTGC